MSYRSALSYVLSSTIEPSAGQTRARERFPRASVLALGEAGLMRMRTRLFELVDSGADGLDPVVVAAAQLLRQPQEASVG
ncbi:hypothetical protein ACWCQN_15985 [Streptomyces sp. NPDC001984]